MKTLRRSLLVLLLAVGPAACSNAIMGPSHNPDGGEFQTDGSVFHNPDGGEHNPDGGEHNPDGGEFGG
jgi:hypothetical protein